jgi:hypothetical protein
MVDCEQGWHPLNEDQCKHAAGYTFEDSLHADANWIDGCFESYSKPDSQTPCV